MTEITIDEARRRLGVSEGALRRVKGALYEEQTRAQRGESPVYITEAQAAVDDAQRRFDFNLRRVKQLEEDQVLGEVLAAKDRREAAQAIVILPADKPKSKARGKRTKATVAA